MFTDLAKKIIDLLINKSVKSLDQNYKFLKLKKSLNIDQLTSDFDSLYTHALLKFSIDATHIAIHLFTLDSVKTAFNACIYDSKDISTVAEELYRQFQYLKTKGKKDRLAHLEGSYSSSRDFLSEIEKFNNWFKYFQNRSSTPFELEQYQMLTLMTEEYHRIQQENLLKSFEFQVKRYLKNFRDEFNKDFPDDLYIDLNGETRILEKGKPLLHGEIDINSDEYMGEKADEEGERIKKIPHVPLDSLVHEWLSEEGQNLLVIMGEYGTGKTTFSRHMAHQLAEYFLESKEHKDYEESENVDAIVPKCERIRTPLYFPLRDFERTFDSFIVNQFNIAGITDIDYFGFMERMEAGEFVLILDGFDEMSKKIDADEKKRNFEKIRQVLDKCQDCKIILTIREEYFQSETDFQSVFEKEKHTNYRFVYLCPFDDDQIQHYLKAHTKDHEFYWNHIQTIFDLHDLAKRPVLLQLIVKYLPRLIDEEKLKNQLFNASDFYEICINDELERKSKKFNFIVPDKYRLQILRELAVWMFLNDALSFNLLLLNGEINLQEYFYTKIPWEFEKKLREFLTFTFLLREDENQYRISHKSFRDYLTAQAFAAEINCGKIEKFARSKTTDEINGFILEQISNKNKLLELVLTSRNLPKEKQWQGTNSANLLLKLDSIILKNQDLSGCQLSHVDFSRCNFTGTDFSGADLGHCSFTKSILSARLENANLEHSLLNLIHSGITDLNAISSIKELRQVKKLVLIGNHITDITPLRDFKQLKNLWLFGNPIPKAQIEALKKALPGCSIE
jgi:Cdc6-like AAA superfamily ATPase